MPKKEYYGLNPEENRSQESLVDEEPTPVYATQLIREVAGKPKTPVKNTIVPVNAEKKSKPDMSQNADGPEKGTFFNLRNQPNQYWSVLFIYSEIQKFVRKEQADYSCRKGNKW